MQVQCSTIDEYLSALPEKQALYVEALRAVVLEHLPVGFEETLQYSMIGYVVPLSLYPEGYLKNPRQPLPFMHIGAQKKSISFYHMGLYADAELLHWFVEQTRLNPKVKHALNMGKSCIRYAYYDEIPLELIGELVSKITPEQWISTYERMRNRG